MRGPEVRLPSMSEDLSSDFRTGARDIAVIFKGISDLVKDAAVNWVHDYAQSMGAALAFYTMFSIAPLLLIVISVAGFFFGEEAARGEVFGQLHDLLGGPGALAVQDLLDSAGRPADSVMATRLRVGFSVHRRDIRLRRTAGRPRPDLARAAESQVPGLWGIVRARLLSFGMILGIGFLLIVSLAFSAGLAALSQWWDPLSTGWATLANASELALGVLLAGRSRRSLFPASQT